MLCAISIVGVKALTILTVDIALNSRKVTQYQAKDVILALKRKTKSSLVFCWAYAVADQRPMDRRCFSSKQHRQANGGGMLRTCGFSADFGKSSLKRWQQDELAYA